MYPTDSTTPHAALRAHVSRYVQIALELPPGQTMRHQLSAFTGSVAAVLWSGQVMMDGLDAGLAPAARIPSCCMIGPLTRWHDNVIAGPLRSFCVHFTPLGANTLLQLHGCGFHDRAVALADLLDAALRAEARSWADEVMHARSFAERVAATDRFLMRRLRGAASRLDLVAAAIARLGRSDGGGDRVSALAADLACSERTLRRRFRDELGLPVKLFARITRFQRAHAYLQGTPGADWAGAVVRFGYVDQAHLIHDYREFAGTTPARFSPGERFLDAALTLSATR